MGKILCEAPPEASDSCVQSQELPLSTSLGVAPNKHNYEHASPQGVSSYPLETHRPVLSSVSVVHL